MLKTNDEKIYKNRWLILAIVVMEPFMCCLDGSIVNVALPVMSKSLSVSMAEIEWVITSYLVVIVATIMVFGRLGDIKGKSFIFKIGLVIFVLGSFMCGISQKFLPLIFSRIIQGIGASAAMATNQGIITHVFPSNERGRALGISGTFVALGAMIGPPLGGLIISSFKWQYIFLINVPIGTIFAIIGFKIMPKAESKNGIKLDFLGSLLFAVFISALFGCIIKGQEIGYGNISIVSGFIISVISLIGFVIVEKRLNNPVLDLNIFKNKLFTVSIICAFIVFTAMNCTNIIMPFYLQDTLSLSPKTTGFIMMVSPIVLSFVAPVSGYLSDKIGSEILTFIGLIILSFGLFLLSFLNQYSSIVYVILFLAVMTLGNGLFQSPNTSLIMSLVPRDKLGIAGSVNALVRNIGIVFGISYSTTLLYNRMSYKIGHHVINYVNGRDDVFIYAMKCVFLSAVVICMFGAFITALRLYSKKSKPDMRKEII